MPRVLASPLLEADQGDHLVDERTTTVRVTDPPVETELQVLPGVGPVLAGRLVEYRRRNGPFRNPAELEAVSGIGPVLLERLRPWLRFR